jgi:hypothetical protein
MHSIKHFFISFISFHYWLKRKDLPIRAILITQLFEEKQQTVMIKIIIKKKTSLDGA